MPVGPLLVFGNDQASNPGASVLTLYCDNPIASGANAGTLSQTVPAASTSTTGWTVATVASGNYSRQSYNNEVPSAGFGTTVQPSEVPINAGQDCWRFGPSTGTFSLGTWYSSLSVIGVTSGGDQDGRARMRIWRATNADGSSPSSTSRQLASDSFTRANENPIAGNWTSGPGALADLQLISNSVAAVSSVPSGAFWNATTWPADQWSEVVITVMPAGSGGPAVRMAAAADTLYSAQVFASASLRIHKLVAGVDTQLLAAGGSGTVKVGDRVRLEVQGTTLRVFLNDVLRGTIEDSAIADGAAGLYATSSIGIRMDDWAGGDFQRPTEITQASGVLLGTTVTNLSTTVAQSSAASARIPMFHLNNEYLFLQTAWEITGAGGAADRDVIVRYGSMGATDGSGLVTAAFVSDAPAVTVGSGLMPFYYRALVMDEC